MGFLEKLSENQNGVSRCSRMHRLILNDWFSGVLVLALGSISVISAMDTGQKAEQSVILAFSALAFDIIIIGEAFAKLFAFRFAHLRYWWDLIDLVLSSGCLFDVVESFIFGSAARPIFRAIVGLRLLRCFVRSIYHEKVTKLTSLFAETIEVMLGVVLTLAYTAVFFSLLAIVGGLLVTADVLPSLVELRSPTGGAWTQARPLFASLPHSVFSLYEILLLDGWYVDFCHPLLLRGKWFSAFITLFVVFAGSLAYSNLLLGCIVDRTVLVSSEMSEASVLANENDLDESRVEVYETLKALGTNANSASNRLNAELILRSVRSDSVIQGNLEAIEIRPGDCRALLNALDGNNDGFVYCDDLKAGLLRHHKDAQGQDIVRINTLSSKADIDSGLIESSLTRIDRKVTSCMANISDLHTLARTYEIRRNESARRREVDRDRANQRAEFRKHLGSTFRNVL